MVETESKTQPDRQAGIGAGTGLKAEDAGGRGNSAILGDIVWLMLRSEQHRKWTLTGIERYILPAIQHRHFRLYHHDNVPVGYVSWALLSEAVEEKFMTGDYPLEPADWISGDRTWIVDFIAPGRVGSLRRHIRSEEPFDLGKVVKAIRPYKDGNGHRIVQFGYYAARSKTNWKTKIIKRGAKLDADQG